MITLATIHKENTLELLIVEFEIETVVDLIILKGDMIFVCRVPLLQNDLFGPETRGNIQGQQKLKDIQNLLGSCLCRNQFLKTIKYMESHGNKFRTNVKKSLSWVNQTMFPVPSNVEIKQPLLCPLQLSPSTRNVFPYQNRGSGCV